MSQSHLTIDFPIKGPANAKALAKELPPFMPDFARTQDQLGTVHFSRFMVKGDEKLLFLSDIDGEIDTHIAAARGACRPGARRHLQARGRPSGHARGRQPSEGHQMAEALMSASLSIRTSRTRTRRFRTSRHARVPRASQALPRRAPC